MARIDYFIGTMQKLKATGVILGSGKNITLRFPTGDRSATQSTPHADLLAMIEEVAPPAAATAVRGGGRARFDYDLAGKPFTVIVEQAAGVMKILLEAGESIEEVPPLAVETPPAPTARSTNRTQRMGSPVEPSHAEVAAPPPGTATQVPPAHVTSGPAPEPRPMSPAPAVREPQVTGGSPAIDKLLLQMIKMKASDLHLSTGVPPIVRHDGEMKRLDEWPVFTAESLERMLYEIIPDKNRKEFEERNDTDFAHAIVDVSRFRANYFRDRHGPGAVFRAIPFKLLSAEQLGLPSKVLDLCYLTKGLVVVTGPTGSGKSTTLATLIDYVNMNRSDHIITIEDPIEFVHNNKKCLINQREVHVHTRSFKDALRAALREDPDIVLVGEMRDLETIAIAVETAETGHLVFGTLHTTTAPGTVDRIIDQFPADRQDQIRQMLAESLKGVIAQTLCKKIGGGRAAAYEILIGSSGVSSLIRQAKTFQLFSLMQTSRNLGMITLNDALLEHVKAKRVEPLEAYMKAVNKGEFKNLLQKIGITIDVQADGGVAAE